MGRRHHSILPKLNRDSNERKGLFKTQLRDLIEKGQLITTVTKAKILKRHFDKLVSKAQQGTLAARRSVIASLSNVKSGNRLVDTLAPHFSDRKSGFTTLEKVSVRRGDSTAMASIKFITPLPEVKVEEVKKVKAVKAAKPVKEVKKVSKSKVKA